jgi:hypothetical protein
MVVMWTILSFTVVTSKVPSGVPRRLIAPLAWESTSLHHWTVIKVRQTILHGFTNSISCFSIVLEVTDINSNVGYGEGFSNTHF